jgi:hypothetical protein
MSTRGAGGGVWARLAALEHEIRTLRLRVTSEAGGGVPAAPHATEHYDGGDDEVDVTQLGGFPGGSPITYLDSNGAFTTPEGDGGGGGSPAGGDGTVIPSTNDFRLTTESGVPVSTSDRTSQGTIYLTPYKGKYIALYDGAAWDYLSSAEVSLALSSLTSGANYDVFAYNNAGTLTLELSAAWTNATTRADALTTQDGVTVKSGSTTRRWVGTIRTTGTATTEDAERRRFVYNADNRVPRHNQVVYATAHFYATNTTRQMNTVATNQIEYVLGADQTGLITVRGGYDGSIAVVSAGLDSTSTDTVLVATGSAGTISIHGVTSVRQLALGYHFWSLNERAGAAPSGVNFCVFSSQCIVQAELVI